MTTPTEPAIDQSGTDDVVSAEAGEAWHRLLFERNPAPMWAFDRDSLRFLAVNDAAVRHYGWTREEFLAMSILDIRPPEDVPLVLERAATARLHRTGPRAAEHRTAELWRHRRRDGSLCWMYLSSTALAWGGRSAVLVLAIDATEAQSTRAALARTQARLVDAQRAAQDEAERQLTESRLLQAHRAEAVARLAAGIAHDFNNLLTSIRCSADLLGDSLEEGDERQLDVADIARAADRAAALTRQLLGFARQQVVEPRVLDLNALVTDLAPMLERELQGDVEVALSLDPTLGTVRADREQLQQVVLALAMNARDAMPQGGVLLLQTANVELDEEAMPEAPGGMAFTPGPYVLLGVSDTGIGMDSETQVRIFEPFFTTKEPGKGTGLGLASVYGIVKQAGGFIWAHSRPNVGTRFTIYLPRVDEAPEPAPVVAPPTVLQARRGETVLVVEDEATILDLACRVLRAHGYTVLRATGGEEALAIAGAHDGAIDLLLTDVVMPRLGGPALADRLLTERASTRVLYISGYTEGDIVRDRVLQRGVQLLEKPFTPRQLLERVRVVLDGA